MLWLMLGGALVLGLWFWLWRRRREQVRTARPGEAFVEPQQPIQQVPTEPPPGITPAAEPAPADGGSQEHSGNGT